MTAIGPGTLRDEPDDLRGVRFERLYDATPAELWRPLTDPGEIAGWLAHASRWTLEPGGEFRLEFGDSDEAVTTGVVREVEAERVLELSWSYPGETDLVVRFELVPQVRGVKLVLDHRLLPASAAVGYGAGWQAHLEALEARLAGRASGDADAWWDRYKALRPAYEEQAAMLEGAPLP
jgi:uncharacterized protein YndB with AHSA1/START domain